MDTIKFIAPILPGDSEDYHVLSEAAARAPRDGLTCEIGLRRGGGSKHIIDSRAAGSTHIAIDPYGNIKYQTSDAVAGTLDYTNDMRDECMVNIYQYAKIRKINFLFFNMDDVEFFNRYADGVPVYQETKRIESIYSLVHFDGPHSVDALIPEVNFFHPRTHAGTVFVFDDIKEYDHNKIDEYLKKLGWSWYQSTERKAAYIKC